MKYKLGWVAAHSYDEKSLFDDEGRTLDGWQKHYRDNGAHIHIYADDGDWFDLTAEHIFEAQNDRAAHAYVTNYLAYVIGDEDATFNCYRHDGSVAFTEEGDLANAP